MGEIPEITNSIERQFLDGVLEVYGTFFTHEVPFYFLDEEKSNINSYGETTNKVYKEPPVNLIARIKIEPESGERAVNRDYNKVVFRVPTQSMWDNGLPTEAKDLAEMIKGKFVWNGIEYQVQQVRPRSLINNTFLFHEFICEEIILDKDSRSGW